MKELMLLLLLLLPPTATYLLFADSQEILPQIPLPGRRVRQSSTGHGLDNLAADG
jgi:hypothetical protein